MSVHKSLIKMLKQLLEDMLALQQLGAGYYSCTPLVRRYNKLLGQARLISKADGLLGTFDDLTEEDPKDPGDKIKIVQGIRVEISQLIALLESELQDLKDTNV